MYNYIDDELSQDILGNVRDTLGNVRDNDLIKHTGYK